MRVLQTQSQDTQVNVQSVWSKGAHKWLNIILTVSLMYRQLQWWSEMNYTTFLDWQVKWSQMLCALFGPWRKVWEVVCLHRGCQQGNELASGRNCEASVECTRISPRFCSRQYDTSRGSGKILHALGLEVKKLKLSSMIRVLMGLNRLYTNARGTLSLVLSLWLVGVVARQEAWSAWLRLFWDWF